MSKCCLNGGGGDEKLHILYVHLAFRFQFYFCTSFAIAVEVWSLWKVSGRAERDKGEHVRVSLPLVVPEPQP